MARVGADLDVGDQKGPQRCFFDRERETGAELGVLRAGSLLTASPWQKRGGEIEWQPVAALTLKGCLP